MKINQTWGNISSDHHYLKNIPYLLIFISRFDGKYVGIIPFYVLELKITYLCIEPLG